MKTYFKFSVTGTYHGAIIYCVSEGDARRIFHDYYTGESIIGIIKRPLNTYEKSTVSN